MPVRQERGQAIPSERSSPRCPQPISQLMKPATADASASTAKPCKSNLRTRQSITNISSLGVLLCLPSLSQILTSSRCRRGPSLSLNKEAPQIQFNLFHSGCGLTAAKTAPQRTACPRGRSQHSTDLAELCTVRNTEFRYRFSDILCLGAKVRCRFRVCVCVCVCDMK
jgi:hypothetical protein